MTFVTAPRSLCRLLSTSIGAMLVLALAACGGGEPATADTETEDQTWEDVVARAQEEGTVSLYGAVSQDVLTSIQEGFEEEYGIAVEALQANAGPQHERVSQSVQAGQVQVDVLLNNDTPFLDELVDMGGVLQDVGDSPNRESFPEEWWPGDYPLVASFTQAVLVNTDAVDPASITSWDDLLAPEYRDRIAVITGASGLGALTFYANLVDSQGEEYLQRLATQNPVVVATSTEGSQMVASGDKDIYLNNVAYNTVPLKRQGAPVEDVYLPPVSVVSYAAVAMQDGPHPAAGRVLVDWLLSEQGQQATCGEQRLTCSLPGISDSLPLPEEYERYDPAEIAERQEDLVASLEATIE